MNEVRKTDREREREWKIYETKMLVFLTSFTSDSAPNTNYNQFLVLSIGLFE